MKKLDMNSHDFQKQNLVTMKNGDLYKCSKCGATGYRKTLAPLIDITETEFKKAKKCTFVRQQHKKQLPKEVLTDAIPHIGLEYGIHKVVECPTEYRHKFVNDVWVFSNSRQEAVRLLVGEYEAVS